MSTELIAALTPIIVFLATQAIKLIAKIPGWLIIAGVVPLLSIGIAYLSDLALNPDMSIWLQAVLGLVGVFLFELKKQLQQIGNK